MREVTFVRFHSSIHVPAVGNLGDTLPHPGKTFPGLKMFDAGDKLEIHAKGCEIIVPMTQVLVAVYGPKEKSKKSE